jgi:hypothetical protein
MVYLKVFWHSSKIIYIGGLVDASRETREGWPLLTVETEVNGDSRSTNERGASIVPGWFVGLRSSNFTNFVMKSAAFDCAYCRKGPAFRFLSFAKGIFGDSLSIFRPH